MTARSPVSERLVEVLADREWHDLDHVISELAKLIPPGRAIREMERSRRNGARTEQAAQAERTYEIDHARLVRSGQRRIALSAIQRGRQNGWVVVDQTASPGRRRANGRLVRMVELPSWAKVDA